MAVVKEQVLICPKIHEKFIITKNMKSNKNQLQLRKCKATIEDFVWIGAPIQNVSYNRLV